MKKKWPRVVPYVILIAAAGILVFSGVVMLLWNSILPAVLHVGTISLLQAAGILLLAKILFGGRRRHGCGHWGRRDRYKKWQYCEYRVVSDEQAK